ncbi:MAG: 2-methyl-6-phytyl-1,4-hydroquinone methyltransferase [Nitrospira sp.]|nr:MAG: 2-methyl-6-phytyl-1,4-hydroquinone methyltransferase [Nitrospira sp.]
MTNIFIAVIVLLLVALVIGLVLYVLSPRKYQSGDSVANSYDDWTNDGILEFYWGEHIHLGHYGSPPRKKDFLEAKSDLVHEMVHWGGLDKLPSGTTVLDVGCGIGGSSRILARDYGCAVTGITLSLQQVRRAQELTSPEVNARFQVDDALTLSFPDASFDVVWSVEAGPHIPDKAQFARELLRVLKPGGVLLVADWNQRDDRQLPLNFWEKPVMRQLLDQWSHPAFSSIEGFSELLEKTGLVAGEVTTADWTAETLPSWLDSIWQGVVRPAGLVRFGMIGVVKSLREVPTFLLMRLAFGTGLCRFGMFRTKRAPVHTSKILSTQSDSGLVRS